MFLMECRVVRCRAGCALQQKKPADAGVVRYCSRRETTRCILADTTDADPSFGDELRNQALPGARETWRRLLFGLLRRLRRGLAPTHVSWPPAPPVAIRASMPVMSGGGPMQGPGSRAGSRSVAPVELPSRATRSQADRRVPRHDGRVPDRAPATRVGPFPTNIALSPASVPRSRPASTRPADFRRSIFQPHRHAGRELVQLPT